MKTILGIIILAVGVYYGAARGWIGGEMLGRLFGLGPSEDQASVEQTVKNTNSRLPRMVNSDISLDRVTASKTEVVFHYRFVDLDKEMAIHKYAAQLPELEMAVVRDVCGAKDIRDYVFAHGHSVQVLLRANDRGMVLNVYVNPSSCRA